MQIEQNRSAGTLFSDLSVISQKVNRIFLQSIEDYHIPDHIDASMQNPYREDQAEHLFYHKCWIDTIQWHLEDEIRAPDIDPEYALSLKRRIDAQNQARTEIVEVIDSEILNALKDVAARPDARINTESPAWALDRLSILALKIYHMRIEVARAGVEAAHTRKCWQKLQILLEQQKVLSQSIDELIADIARGLKSMKVYKQMKMYNDESLNPILYRRRETL